MGKRRLLFYPCVKILICCINFRTIRRRVERSLILLILQASSFLTHKHIRVTSTSSETLVQYVTLRYAISFVVQTTEV